MTPRSVKAPNGAPAGGMFTLGKPFTFTTTFTCAFTITSEP
jgi:hypothetical protein